VGTRVPGLAPIPVRADPRIEPEDDDTNSLQLSVDVSADWYHTDGGPELRSHDDTIPV
jgi:hypothetical protein